MIKLKLKLREDFSSFAKPSKAKIPQDLSNSVLHHAYSTMNPDHMLIFSKLISIQIFIGVISLVFCPQFNLSLTNNFEVFHYFHHNFGVNICSALCGSIFVGSGAIFAAYILKENEITIIKESKWWYYFSVSLVLVSALSVLGSDIYFSLVIFWFAGALLGGLMFFELSRITRHRIFSY